MLYSDDSFNGAQGKTSVWVDVMLNAGSTPLPFEPYTGGKPSPSPDYPQEIHSAGDEGEIDIGATGKNLLNNAGYQLTATNLRWGRDEGYNGIILKAHTQYTLSVNDSLPIPNAMCINYKPSNKTIYSKSNVRSITYTPEEDVLVSLDAVWDNGRPENATHFQLEIGSTATSYEPYQSQFLAFDTPDGLPGVPVSSGGNFVDSTGQEWICNYRDYDAEKDIKTIEYIANYNNESVGDIWMSTTGQLTVGASVLYALDTPIQSSIPADELAAYRALHAYDGTTVITPDDALAEVEVDYIVKPKPYIEKKLTAIESRLNALEISEALEGE